MPSSRWHSAHSRRWASVSWEQPSLAQRLADLFSVLAPAFLKWQYAGILVEGMTYRGCG